VTEQIKRFADQYFATLNGKDSAIYAGYSKKTAKVQASQLLDRDDVQEYLQKLRAQKAEETGITQSWVMERFKLISDACVTATPVMVFDPVNKCMVQKVDVDGHGVYEFDSSGANKATEMLGKIIGVFEKDNEQSKPVTTLPTINVYNSAPPIATNEKDINV
jgi:phage terminase small subunit